MRRQIIALPLLMTAGMAVADDHRHDNDSHFALGIGVGYSNSIYRGVDNESRVLPVVFYEGDDFYIRGPKIGYQLLEDQAVNLDLVLQYRSEGYEASDSVYLHGMDERKGAFELGLSSRWKSDYGDWSATALTDVSSEHKGYELALGWEQRIPLSAQWALTPEATMSYRSKDLNNYYYGVRTHEVSATRTAYTADAGMVYTLGVSANYQIDAQQQIRLGTSYQYYGNEISDSSIVEDDSNISLRAIYLYRF